MVLIRLAYLTQLIKRLVFGLTCLIRLIEEVSPFMTHLTRLLQLANQFNKLTIWQQPINPFDLFK